jgi:sugar (pentulose or hexulose) kinase
MFWLGIDTGSSFIKAALLDPGSGAVREGRSVPAPDFLDSGNSFPGKVPPSSSSRREISVDALTETVKALINVYAEKFPIEGILFSVQMHGFELYSPCGGRAVTNYVTWQDRRAFGSGGGTAAKIRKIAAGELRRDGVILNNSHSLSPLFHFLQEEKPAGPLAFALLGDAVIRRLTGQVIPIHPTEAASTGMYDLEGRDWNRRLLDILSLEKIEFPPVAEKREPAAYFRPAKGKEIPVYLPVGDHQAAILGSGAAAGSMVINIGTGGQICWVDNGLGLGPYETRPFFSGLSLRTLSDLPSGRSLSAFVDFFWDIGKKVFGIEGKDSREFWEKIKVLAEKAVAAGGKLPAVDMNFFDGEGGAIRGITADNLSAGNLAAAAYTAMADAAFDGYRRLELGGVKPANLIGAGGVLLRTPLLRDMISRRFGMPLKSALHPEDVMYGLLKLGRWHAGYTEDPLVEN